MDVVTLPVWVVIALGSTSGSAVVALIAVIKWSQRVTHTLEVSQEKSSRQDRTVKRLHERVDQIRDVMIAQNPGLVLARGDSTASFRHQIKQDDDTDEQKGR